MNINSKIYVAGHLGLVGSALWKNLQSKGYSNLIGRTINELDLMDARAVNEFFAAEQPEYVILAAAKVGGIVANNTYRGQFIYENLMIQNNVIHAAYLHKVKKLLFLGSTCIYPRDAPQPMPEDCLLTGPLEYTNEPYAIAKIAGIKLCESYNLQYGTNFISVMPTNLYGPNDNFDLEKSHVLPAMLRKMHLGKCLEDNNWEAIREDLNKRPIEGISGEDEKMRNGEGEKVGMGEDEKMRMGEDEKVGMGEDEKMRMGEDEKMRNGENEKAIVEILSKYGITLSPSHLPTFPLSHPLPLSSSHLPPLSPSPLPKVSVELWGTGTPLREFLWSEEMADACVFLIENINFEDVNPCNPRNPSKSAQSPSCEIRNSHINIGTGIEITIRDLAELIKEKVGFKGELVFNSSKPDGSMRKLTDPSKLHALGWHHKIEIDEGIEKLYDWYLGKF